MKWWFSIVLILIIDTAHAAVNLVLQPSVNQKNSPSNSSDKWFEYAKSTFQHIYEKGLYQDYKKVIENADKGIALIRDSVDFEKFGTYYFHKGYAHKVQLKNDSAYHYLSKSITYASLATDIGTEVRAITQLNYLLRFLGRNNETAPFVRRLSTLLLQVEDIKYREAILTSLSEAHLYNGNYKKAISYILPFIPTKVERFKKEPNYANRVNLGNAYANLGNMYLQIGQLSKATHYLKLALPQFYDYIGATVRAQNSLINVYLKREILDSALYYYQKVYESNSDIIKFYESAELANANLYFAEYYLLKKQFSEAKQYAKRATYFSDKSERLETILKTKKFLARLNLEKSDYHSALLYLNQILPQAHIFNKDFYNEILLLLAKSYEGIKNYQQALHYFQLYNSSSAQTFEEKSDEEILAVEIKYQTKEKQKEIDNLVLQKKLTNDLIKSKNKLQLLLVGFMLLLILIAGLIYKNYANKKAANKLLEKRYEELQQLSNQLQEANITKAKLFSIISHDLRSPVSELFAFLKMQESSTHLSEKKLKSYQQKLLRSSSHLLETMEDLLIWSKSQLERFEIEQEEIILADLFENILSLLEISLAFKNSSILILDANLGSVISDQNILLTIMRNLLQNAINSSPDQSEITIQTFTAPRKYILISNPSIDSSSRDMEMVLSKTHFKSNSNGLGIILVKELTELLGLEIEFSRTENVFHVKLFFS